MATFGDMKARIQSEMDRTDIASFVADAIKDAIREYEIRQFWFNETRDLTVSTVAAQRIYTSSDAAWIGDGAPADLFLVVGGQNRPPMARYTPAEMEYLADASVALGEPYAWTYFDRSIQLYPIPGAVYTLRGLGSYTYAELSSDSDTNPWTNEAERLIRRRAKQLLFAEVLNSPQEASAVQPLIDQALADLDYETSSRRATGTIRPTRF